MSSWVHVSIIILLFVLSRSLVISKEFAGQTDKIERWYEVEYKVEPHSEELEAKWKALEAHEDLHIPEPNAFIPHDFDLCERDPDNTKYPRIIKVSECLFRFLLW